MSDTISRLWKPCSIWFVHVCTMCSCIHITFLCFYLHFCFSPEVRCILVMYMRTNLFRRMSEVIKSYGVSSLWLPPLLSPLSCPHIGECISGALEWKELMRIATGVGFAPPVLVGVSPITIDTPEFQKVVGQHLIPSIIFIVMICYRISNSDIDSLLYHIGDLKFCSATYRLFKIDPDPAISSSKNPLIQVQYKGV